jgi:hypothetical protein
MTDQTNPPASRPKRRWPRRVLVAFLVLACLYVAYRYTLHRMVEAKLDEIRKQGYPVTLAELDKWYSQPPPGENAADLYEQAFAQYAWTGERYVYLGAGEIVVPPLSKKSVKLPVGPENLSEEFKSVVAGIVHENREALTVLHEDRTLTYCRYPIDLKLPHVSLPHLHKLREGIRLLQLESIQRTEEGDFEGAAMAVLSSIRLARSLENEPIEVSQLVRNSCFEITTQSLQRMLNRSQLSDRSLIQLIDSLEASEAPNAMTRGFVGERCLLSALFQNTINEQLAVLGPPPDGAYGGFLFTREELGRFRIRFAYLKITGLMSRDHASFLDLIGNVIEATKSPYPEMLKKVSEVHDQVTLLPRSRVITRYMLGTILIPFSKAVRCVAQIRTAEIATALERCRLANRRLPETLQELVPTYLSAIPTDPFDGQPMRYKRLAKGYIVYSIGENGTDDGGDGTVSARTKWMPADITFTVER